ncbi:hypothetical protein C2845_PM01G13230 [Panicum miliaceum]|uniref:Uncharacterized protein n=1 Tax=Panicum miliaceum TaxID=4540 RepID=A0A3L6TKF6_PANMI|nr:hypothetical protein C2845_PM01G13230 [Panicum miliaceum]
MGGSLVSMLRWPPDLGLPSLAALLPSPPAHLRLRVQEWWQWQWSSPEQLGAAAARRWPEVVRDVPLLVDAALWGVVTAVESVALVSMMCCFFLCCGCTL